MLKLIERVRELWNERWRRAVYIEREKKCV